MDLFIYLDRNKLNDKPYFCHSVKYITLALCYIVAWADWYIAVSEYSYIPVSAADLAHCYTVVWARWNIVVWVQCYIAVWALSNIVVWEHFDIAASALDEQLGCTVVLECCCSVAQALGWEH